MGSAPMEGDFREAIINEQTPSAPDKTTIHLWPTDATQLPEEDTGQESTGTPNDWGDKGNHEASFQTWLLGTAGVQVPVLH